MSKIMLSSKQNTKECNSNNKYNLLVAERDNF